MSSPSAYPALEALVDAYHRRLNGRIVFRRAGVERSVVLLFRKLVFANSTEKKDRLELVLATRKLLSKEGVLSLAAKAKAANCDFMTIVQREGALKDVALFDVMSERARDIVVDLITWPDCEINHDPRGMAGEPVLPLNSPLLPILLDGLLARFGADDCRRLLGSEDQVPTRLERPYVLRELSKSAHAALASSVLERVDGRRAINEILGGLDDEGLTGMKMLAALRLLGAVDLPQPQSAPALAAAPEPVPAVDIGPVTAAVDLSSEERAALSNIFEGATNLLEEDGGDASGLEIVVEGEEDEILIGTTDEEPAASAPAAPAAEIEEPRAIAAPAADAAAEAPAPPPAYVAPKSLFDDDETVSTPQVQNDFNALLDIDPEEAAGSFSAGLEAHGQGRIAAALELYRQAIDKDPSNPEYYAALGRALLEGAPPDLHGAMTAFLEAVKLSPDAPKYHFNLGEVYEARGESETAVGAYEEALRRGADYSPAKQALDRLKGKKPEEGGFLRKLFGR